MSLLRAVGAELRKTATLPGAFVAVAVTALGSAGITLLNAIGVRDALQSGQLDTVGYTSPVEAVFSAVPIGTVGAIILGVVVISSEYTANSPDAGGGRQITATLTATPHRLTILAAKAITLVALVAVTAAITISACLALAHLVVGDTAPSDTGDMLTRGLGAALYWTLMGLIALAITVLTRSGIAPLIVLIANSSLVSVSILLTNLISLAYYLPDLAGMRLFASGDAWLMFDDALDPLAGALVMAAWALGLLGLSAVVFTRRDA